MKTFDIDNQQFQNALDDATAIYAVDRDLLKLIVKIQGKYNLPRVQLDLIIMRVINT